MTLRKLSTQIKRFETPSSFFEFHAMCTSFAGWNANIWSTLQPAVASLDVCYSIYGIVIVFVIL